MITPTGDVSPTYSGDDPWEIVNNDWDKRQLRVGNTGIGTLQIDAASVVNNNGSQIGYFAGSTGTVTVTDAGSVWNNNGYMLIGEYGIGTLNIANGGIVNTNTLDDYFAVNILGNHAGSIGIANVSGTGSTWNNGNNLRIGGGGTGTLNIEHGGVVNVVTSTYVSSKASESSGINFNHGVLNTGNLLASPSDLHGTGTINTTGMITDSDLVFDASTGLTQQLVLNSEPNQNITINLDISDPASDSWLGAGYRGTGTLTIADGLTVSSTRSYLGYYSESQGTAIVTGMGTVWDVERTLYVGYQGVGTLNIENGGVVNSETTFLRAAADSTSIVTVSGAGSSWNTGSLELGREYYGRAELNITNGGIVSSHSGFIQNGSVLVSDNGSSWTHASNLSIDAGGELIVRDGAHVMNDDGLLGNTYADLNEEPPAASATISGVGSTWTNAGNLTIGGASYYSTLNIEEGGIINVGENTRIQHYSRGRYSIEFNNGTLNTGSLTASVSDLLGSGTINTTGLISDVDIVFDASRGLTNTIVLNSLPDQNIVINLDASGHNIIPYMGAGYTGSGSLVIADGLTLSSEQGYIGYYYGSTGTATVTGVGTRWDNSGRLYVGYEGDGTLNIQDGAVVSVGGWGMTLGGDPDADSATLNLTGGVLDMNGSDITGSLRSAEFNFTGGTLKGAGSISFRQRYFDQEGGTLAPGGSIGETFIDSSYRLIAGTIEIELGGAGNLHDTLIVRNDMKITRLGTTLDLSPIGPMGAGTYTILETQYGFITGEFEQITGLGEIDGLVRVNYGVRSVTITLRSDYIPEPGTLAFLSLGCVSVCRRSRILAA